MNININEYNLTYASMITFSERRYGAEIGGSELLIDFSDSSGGKTFNEVHF